MKTQYCPEDIKLTIDGEEVVGYAEEPIESLISKMKEQIKKLGTIKSEDFYVYVTPDFWFQLQNGYEKKTKKRAEKPWYRKGRW